MNDLDSINKLVQISFYVITVIIGVCTYRNAKKGLLNPVNTEYQKKVIERLSEISTQLGNEFYNDSTKNWYAINNLQEPVNRINSIFTEYKEKILKEKKFVEFAYPLPELSTHLRTLISRIKFDPFVPKDIRNLIIDLLESRLNYTELIIVEELEKYKDELALGMHTQYFEYNDGLVENRVNNRLEQLGLDEIQIEESVNNIQSEIQNYFNSFKP